MNQPASTMIINELIAAGKYDAAQELCDQNVLYFRDRQDQFQNLFIHAEERKLKAAKPLDQIVQEEDPREAGNL